EGKARRSRRRRPPSNVDGQGGRQHADVDAEDGACPSDRDESLDSPPRSVVGVLAATGRAGPIDLWAERRRESVRRAHLRTSGSRESPESTKTRKSLGLAS